MSPLANFANDQRQIQDDFPSLLEFDGRRFDCTATEITQNVNMDENGYSVAKAFDVLAVNSEFNNTPPAIRSTVTLDGTTYQVGDVEIDTKTDSIRFFLHKS